MHCDLQKLRCKVAFHALRFAAPIENLGNKLARRMWIEGPYIALHLRLEKDVWVRTGCLTGLGSEFDRIIAETRMNQPKYLTGRLNMTYTERRLAGLCPLNAYEIARFLKALGAPRNASIYIAGGEPFGGSQALEPLSKEFPILVTKETLAHKGELLPYANRSSALAAIDYIVSLSSDVFLPSHGGNMAKAMQSKKTRKGAILLKQINEKASSVHAYVVFETEQSAEASLAHNMTLIGGNHIHVDRACPPRKKLKGDAHLYDPKRTVFMGNLPFDVKVLEWMNEAGVQPSNQRHIYGV